MTRSTGTEPSLNEILNAQVSALRALKLTLEDEERAIIERDVDGLNRATAKKSEQLSQLKELETLRRHATAVIDGPELAELRQMLGEVRTRNHANGSLIQAQSQHLARLLRLLRGGAETRQYGQDGRQLEVGRRSTLASV